MTATKRTRKPPLHWVTMGPEPHLVTCQRCGGHVPKPPLPVPMKAFLAYMTYAGESHRECKEAPP